MGQARLERNLLQRRLVCACAVIAACCTFAAANAQQLVVSGSPPNFAVAGQAYSFTPSVHTTSGGAVAFWIVNQPPWATFNHTTGQLSGVPSAADAGVYPNISIVATDWVNVSTLEFPMSVLPTGPGVVNATWTPPTENIDGSVLTTLAGTRIYYGTSPLSLTHMVQVAGAAETSYTFTRFPAGLWYFGLRAYTTDGAESPLSPIVGVTVQ